MYYWLQCSTLWRAWYHTRSGSVTTLCFCFFLTRYSQGVSILSLPPVRNPTSSTVFTDAVDKIIGMDMLYVMTPMYPTQPLSPLSSVLAGMGHLADLSRIISNPRTGREQDAEALRDDWLAVGTDLRQAIHMYERINKGRRKK
jgi:hypothetical protein